MKVDDLLELLRVQVPPMGAQAVVAGLMVAPDVWARLLADVQRINSPAGPAFSWTVTVDPYLPEGAIVPVDRDGRPVVEGAR